MARNIGTHAAAVVIADKPLDEYVPLTRVPGKQDVITQWSMNDVEASGLLKMDFLGLRNLTIMSRTVDLIKQTTGKELDLYRLPLDDKASYALLQRGETKGVFQLESGGIRDLLCRMKPDKFDDIIATAALYRPGPLEGGMVDDYVNIKHGRQEPEYKHEVLKEILEETNSVMVYQEQVMRILNRLGKIPLANAYTCIKAISKKKESLINENHDAFIVGSVENGLGEKDAEDIWNLIVKFAGYGFNKSHSTAYALVAFQTAFLKAHHPVEFMAALLSSDISGRNFKRKDALIEHMEDCDRMEIEVVPPSVNTSAYNFSVDGKQVFFALSAIKGCGGATGVAIEEERKKNGPFKDIFDFCERIDPGACNKSSIETLVKAGAMDCFGAHRSQLAAVIERAVQAGAAVQADKRSGQTSLFGAFDEEEEEAGVVPSPLPDMEEWPDREKLVSEKEVLGYYLDSHPLAEFEKKLATFRTHTIDQLSEAKDRDEVTLGGMISSIKVAHTKHPKPGQPSKYANFDLEDMQSSIRCISWPRGFADHGDKIQPDAIVLAKGKVDRRGGGDEANLIIDELTLFDDLEGRYTHGMRIKLNESEHGPETVHGLREILRGYPGKQELLLTIQMTEGDVIHMKVDKQRVGITPELRERLEDYLGPGSYRLMMSKPR